MSCGQEGCVGWSGVVGAGRVVDCRLLRLLARCMAAGLHAAPSSSLAPVWVASICAAFLSPLCAHRSVVADGGAAGDDCVAMTDIQLAAGQQYYFLLSDADLLEFVVPMSLVSSFEVTPVPSEAAAAQ